MRRGLFMILVGLSLLLCVATVVLWMRSQAVCYDFSYCRSGKTLQISTVPGGVVFEHSDRADGTCPNPGLFWTRTEPLAARVYFESSDANTIGINASRLVTFTAAGQFFESRKRVRVHMWIVVLATGLVPSVWIFGLCRSAGRDRRCGTGTCTRCGYDLRATPDRCPECGTTSTSSGQAAG